jgi:D-alanine-D-alanine ligase
MSKRASKQRFLAHGVPTPPFAWIAEEDSLAEVARRVAPLGYPVILKPDDQGSSVGVAVAAESAELPQALAEARLLGGACLAEPLISGREFTVALIDDRTLPVIEILAPDTIFSYDAKYHSPRTQYRLDFELPPSQRMLLERVAARAAGAVGTQGLCRVDLMLDRENNAWVLEVNTVPGMTIRSLAPLAAARAGIDMPLLCELLVRRCLLPSGVA